MTLSINRMSRDEFKQLFNALRDPSFSDQSLAQKITHIGQVISSGWVQNLTEFLPFFLSLEGYPYSLEHHCQFEPMFSLRIPDASVWMTGRQLSKTTSSAAAAVIHALVIPRFRQLLVTPLYEQVRRMSSNYIKKFIDQSPVRSLMSSPKTENSVLRKTFINGSMMEFTFSSSSADRSRGVSTDFIKYDEVQDSNSSFFPIINEALSHSRYNLLQYQGTPKTPENTLSGIFQKSSQAEWFIPCRACKHWNIPSLQYDLLKIIGPWREDISEERPGTVCAKCSRPIYPSEGQWVHRYPERRWTMAGYHVPQPIVHIHYSNPQKWGTLLAKQEGEYNFTPDRFNNEVLGEPSGTGSQLVSQLELQRACVLEWKNPRRNEPIEPACMKALASRYKYKVLSADWGGGGKQKVRNTNYSTSLTTLALLGITTANKVEVCWGKRLLTPHDHLLEAKECLKYFRLFKPNLFTHDFSGAGSVRESILSLEGIPLSKIMPISYVRHGKQSLLKFHPADEHNPRQYYSADKSRSLVTTCSAIRTGHIRFFQWDWQSSDNPGLISDFLGLVEEKITSRTGSDSYMINRHVALSDDFAQAVNVGCLCLWKMAGIHPNIADDTYKNYGDSLDASPINEDQNIAEVDEES